jgi:hypothetical protein
VTKVAIFLEVQVDGDEEDAIQDASNEEDARVFVNAKLTKAILDKHKLFTRICRKEEVAEEIRILLFGRNRVNKCIKSIDFDEYKS